MKKIKIRKYEIRRGKFLVPVIISIFIIVMGLLLLGVKYKNTI